MSLFEEAKVKIDKLLLDPNNYRFQDERDYRPVAEIRIAEDSVQRKAMDRLRDTSLEDLKRSIRTNGFLSVERIVAKRLSGANRHSYLVLEGNRRVAALKSILAEHEAGDTVSKDLLETLNAIPILVVKNSTNARGLYESIMGIRHVSGIKHWGGYQRSRLIANLRDNVEIEPNEVADRLGMSVREVNRRYRAYKALEQMENDDDYGDFADAKLYPLFHEAVSSTGIKEWLSWNEDEGRFTDENELTQFYDWISPRHADDPELEDDLPPKITNHRDVRDLPSILNNEEALNVLKERETSLADALAIAKRGEISKAWKRYVSSAVSALSSLSANDLATMSNPDVKRVQELQKSAEKTLTMIKKLKS